MIESGWDFSDGAALHSRIAFRSAQDQTRIGRREVRDLSLIAGLAMLAPLTLFSLAVGVAPAISCMLAVATVAVASASARVLSKEYGVICPSCRSRTRASQIPTAVLRIIPARHQALTVSKVRSTASPSGRRVR